MEIDEIDLGFCLIHVFYMVLPCGYTYFMGVYIIEIKHNGINKIIVLGPKKVLSFPNLFTYYEQTLHKNVF